MNKIFIFGSCVTRDIFEIANTDNKYSIIEYFARSSIASIHSTKQEKKVLLNLKFKSPFQKKIVEYDLMKVFSKKIKESDYDLLLLDFIDERFNLFLDVNNSIFTLSSELLLSGFMENKNNGRVIKSKSVEFLSLWEKGWKILVAQLKELGTLDKLYIHKVYFSKVTKKGGYSDFKYNIKEIKENNDFLDELYKIVEKDIPKEQLIQVSKELRVANEDHKWGKLPFHFIDEYYQNIMYKIDESLKFNKVIDFKKIKEDGQYKICLENNQYLDILIRNLDILLGNIKTNITQQTVLINFAGAITNRKENTSIYFQGERIAKELNLPFILISDPTFKLDPKIKLAWYLGNKDILDLPIQIAKFLDEFAKKYNTKFILFGGSGGGFASLVQSSLLKAKSIISIWNPQTDILDYVPSIADEYFKVSKVKKEEVQHSIRNNIINSNTKVLYLQNISDWHFKKHMIPYFKNKKIKKYGNSTWITKDGKITLFCGNWGEGHSVPPREMILKILENLIKTENPVMTAWMLEKGIEGVFDKPENLEIPEFNVDQELKVINKIVKNTGNEYTFAVEANDKKVKYAFYLYKNNERIKTQWYTRNNNYIVNLKGPGLYKVAYFIVRESVENKGKANSEDKTSGFFEEIVIK